MVGVRGLQNNLQKAFAIAILSRIATKGIAINDDPSPDIISLKYNVSLPIVVENGGGRTSGNPDATLPVKANGASPVSNDSKYAKSVPINTANAFRPNEIYLHTPAIRPRTSFSFYKIVKHKKICEPTIEYYLKAELLG